MADCDPETAYAHDARFTGPGDQFRYRCICTHPIAKPYGFIYTDPKGRSHPFLVGSVCIKNIIKEEPDISEALAAAIYNKCLGEGCEMLIDKEKKVKNECTKYYCPKHRAGHNCIYCTRCGKRTPFERPKKTTCPECYPKECRKKRNLKLLPPGVKGCNGCGKQIETRYDMCYSCRFPNKCAKCGKGIQEKYKTCFGCR